MTANSGTARAIGARLWAFLIRNRRAVRDALVIAGIGRMIWYYAVQGIHPWEFAGIDARAYWRVDLVHPYAASAVGAPSTYLYPPVFAQVLAPLWVLPFPLFYGLWTTMLVAVLAWLVRPWPWSLAILSLPISYELFVGNIHLLVAAVVVVGFSRPGLWAVPLLSKVTPGVGIVWFAIRRDWRPMAVAIGVTTLALAVSVLLSPGAWAEWIAFVLADGSKGEALPLRVAAAVAIVAFAGLTDRRWLVPVGVWLAFPVLWVETFVVLLAMIRLMPGESESTRPALVR